MKRLFSFVFVIISLLISTVAFAATNPDDFDYIVTVDDTVTITGYHGNRQKVEIPSRIEDCPVTAIADNAFSPNASSILASAVASGDWGSAIKRLNGNDLIVKVIVPKTVTSIGKAAFANCANLTEIQLPKNLESINDFTFYRCISLSEITLPKSVTYIGQCAFSASGISSIDIPDSVTYIGSRAFSTCEQLKSITWPEHYIEMGDSVFGWTNAPDKIPAWMTKFGKILNECGGITNLTIPASEKEIVEYAFASCRNLRTVTIKEGVEKIGRGAFSQCGNLEEVIIENGISEIGAYAFWRCSNLKVVHIPASVNAIAENAFEDCKQLEKIIVPANSWAAQNLRSYGAKLIIQ